MTPLIACTACPRYIRASERTCPFCGADAPLAADAPVLHSSNTGARRSRAASFALRSALVAGATSAAVACGGSGDIPRPNDDPTPAPTASNGGTGGSSSGGGNGSGGAAGSGGASDSAGSGGSIDLADAGAPAEEEDAGAYVPIPIYGGAFPDPMTRARV